MKATYASVDEGAVIHLVNAGEHGWLITSVGVLRSMRGQGAASRLLDVVIEDADREGVQLILSIEPDGTGLGYTALRAFYERHGFKPMPHAETGMVRPCRLHR